MNYDPSINQESIRLREATPLDSTDLNRFFSEIPTQGLIEFKIHRQIDFFSFYHRLNVQFKTYIMENSLGHIWGTASFIIRQLHCQNCEFKVGFACDLRISSVRQAIIHWGRFFLPKIKNLKNHENIQHFMTSINLTDTNVINAFIRLKNRRSHRPVYELIQKFNLVTLHGFYPLIYKKNPFIKVEKLKLSEKQILIDYIQKKLSLLDLVPHEFLYEFEKTITESILYSWSQFVIAKNDQNEIVGCVHPLSSTLLQDYFPQKYISRANNFRQFLKFASWIGLARKLTKPFSRTNKNQTLNFKFMHFFFFDHPDVMNNLVFHTFKGCKNNEFLIYAYQLENFSMKPPLGSIHTEIPHALYEIHEPSYNPKDSLKNKISKYIFLDQLYF